MVVAVFNFQEENLLFFWCACILALHGGQGEFFHMHRSR